MSGNSKSAGATRRRLSAALQDLPGLATVEALVSRSLKSEAPLLEQIPLYLLNLGGKRIRPALALLSAAAFGMQKPCQALIDLAAGVELIHMATLLHDDIIDNSPLRRHQQSPYAKFGLGDTMLAGDFLYIRAFSLCARLDPFIINATEKACVELTEGEILETSLAFARHDLDSALTIARKKTAALFRLSTSSGTHLAAAAPQTVQAMARFGEELGIAFQVLDDILDVTCDAETLGKPAGTDLRERKPSAVNILWLQSNSPLSKTLLQPPGPNDEEFVEKALTELRRSRIVDSTKEIARRHADAAASALSAACSSSADIAPHPISILQELIAFTLERME